MAENSNPMNKRELVNSNVVRRQKWAVGYSVIGAVLLLAFQNCGNTQPVDFSVVQGFNSGIAPASGGSNGNGGRGDTPGTSQPNLPSNPAGDSPGDKVSKCVVGEGVSPNACSPINPDSKDDKSLDRKPEVEDKDCYGYVSLEVNSTGQIIVPAKTESHICYSLKLFDAYKATDAAKFRNDIKAAAHGAGRPSVAAPLILGEKRVSIRLDGLRKVYLSADKAAEAKIRVDNFLLMEVDNGKSSVNWAAGTADSRFLNAGGEHLLIQNRQSRTEIYDEVPFSAFAKGGSADIPISDLSRMFSVGMDYDLRLTALDCGLGKSVSAGYLVFK
jgi:hypothetical protein